MRKNIFPVFILFLLIFLILSCSGNSNKGEAQATQGEKRQIEEPDIYRIVGNTLYIANVYKGLIAVDITNKDIPTTQGSLSLNGVPKEMYFRNNNAIVLLDSSLNYYPNYYYGKYNQKSKVSFVDITNHLGMKLITEVEMPGIILDSRVVGDVLYVITNEYDKSSNESDYYYNYYYYPIRTNYITSINLNTYQKIDSLSLNGSSPAINVTENDIFVVSSDYNYWETNSSTITRYDITEPNGKIIKKSSIDITGSVYDRFKLDFYEDYLRVVAYDWGSRVTNLISINWLSKEKPVIANVLSLGKRESLFATRFSGKVGFIVTFLQKDPLYVIDFSNPDEPVIAYAMNDIPGWSDHIEVIGDKLFALGRELGKVKVAYFDVSNPYAPEMIQTIFLGSDDYYSYSSSGASWDYKRMSYLPSLNAFAIPVTYNDYETRQRKNIVSIVGIFDNEIKVIANLEHNGDVKRTIEISSENYYTYSDSLIMSYHIKDGKVTYKSKLTLCENVIYVAKLNDNYGIKMIYSDAYNYYYNNYAYYSPGELVLKTFDVNDKSLDSYVGEFTIKIDNQYSIIYPRMSLVKNGFLYIVESSSNYYYNQNLFSVYAINLTNPSEPTFSGKTSTIYCGYQYKDWVSYPYAENGLYDVDDKTIMLFINRTVNFINVSGNFGCTSYIPEPEDGVRIDKPLIIDDKLYLFRGESTFFTSFNSYNYDVYVEIYDISDPMIPKLICDKKINGMPLDIIGDKFITLNRKVSFTNTRDSIILQQFEDKNIKTKRHIHKCFML